MTSDESLVSTAAARKGMRKKRPAKDPQKLTQALRQNLHRRKKQPVAGDEAEGDAEN